MYSNVYTIIVRDNKRKRKGEKERGREGEIELKRERKRRRYREGKLCSTQVALFYSIFIRIFLQKEQGSCFSTFWDYQMSKITFLALGNILAIVLSKFFLPD